MKNYIKFLPEVRGGAQRAEGSVIMEKQLNDPYSPKKINQDFKDARTVRPYQSIEFSHPAGSCTL